MVIFQKTFIHLQAILNYKNCSLNIYTFLNKVLLELVEWYFSLYHTHFCYY